MQQHTNTEWKELDLSELGVLDTPMVAEVPISVPPGEGTSVRVWHDTARNRTVMDVIGAFNNTGAWWREGIIAPDVVAKEFVEEISDEFSGPRMISLGRKDDKLVEFDPTRNETTVFVLSEVGGEGEEPDFTLDGKGWFIADTPHCIQGRLTLDEAVAHYNGELARHKG